MPTSGPRVVRGAGVTGALAVILLIAGVIPGVAVRIGTTTAGALSAPCSGQNPVVCENQLRGTPRSQWDVTGAGDPTLQGFATAMSARPGEQIGFKVRTDAPAYSITIFRIGFYAGDGARRIDEVAPAVSLPQQQPPCLTQPGTGLVDCGTWETSATWTIPDSAVSGVYLARLQRPDTGGASHIIFVVRDDARASDIVMQTSDTTWQAYNTFGGNSFYTSPSPRGRAVKVSYNRPLQTRGLASGRDSFFSNEFPMVQFLEANGLDVTYISGMDVARRDALLGNHRVFMSVGHDEYWTGSQRAAVERARDAGVSLAFFGGNSIYWRARWETSPVDDVAAVRTLVCFKESWASGKSDPSAQWTGTWRDTSQSARNQPGVRPENALMGTAYKSNSGSFPLRVPASFGTLRIWRNTDVAHQKPGDVARLGRSIVGYEFDEDLDNGWRPPGLIRLSETGAVVNEYLVDDGSRVAPAKAVHRMTLYRAPSGALVFSAGTVQWAWGLGMPHVGDPTAPTASVAISETVPGIRQATLNVLADMGAIAATPQAGLVAATPSTDRTGPDVVITGPPDRRRVSGPTVLLHGTAEDEAGVVAGVEYSLDEGSTWRPAHGRTTWHVRVALTGSGRRSILVRAVDDSANVGHAARRHLRSSCPCSAMGDAEPTVLRGSVLSGETALEVGTVFAVEKTMRLTGIRFYRGPWTRSSEVLRVWSPGGRLLWEGPATSTSGHGAERGWHASRIHAPLSLKPHRRYVVSLVTDPANYAVTEHVLDRGSIHRPPLTLLAGVFRYGTDRRMPSATFAGALYPIDPVVDFVQRRDADRMTRG